MARDPIERTIMSRLQSIAPEVAQRLSEAAPNARQRVALVAAQFAVSTSGLSDPEVLRQFSAVGSGEALGPDAQRRLANVVETLDYAAWQIQDQVDAGTASANDYLQAFGRARAAASVAYAAAGDAMEASCEAAATTDDPGPLWTLVDAELSIP
ncbi:hypothetical protein [Nocardioides limicola]|uniref:hypothetical protein n=1 Tax=Nocardioides limicola TaxID=2803368 RepID=UPI00193BE08D|nr:hypothetical protein [Nocardioides sp. DJM-14]